MFQETSLAAYFPKTDHRLPFLFDHCKQIYDFAYKAHLKSQMNFEIELTLKKNEILLLCLLLQLLLIHTNIVLLHSLERVIVFAFRSVYHDHNLLEFIIYLNTEIHFVSFIRKKNCKTIYKSNKIKK